MSSAIISFSDTLIYDILIWFLALFPVLIAALAINSSRQFLIDRQSSITENYLPHTDELDKAKARWPLISIVIPARNEEQYLKKTIEKSLELLWPKIELIIINDGSTDKTKEIIDNYLLDERFKVINHELPQGKSRSLNDGIALASSEVVLIMDADALPARNSLYRLVSHLMVSDEVAAVTGNPRVIYAPNLLTKLQAIEFSSTISILRRGQSAWGRVNTFSGIMTILRKSIVQEVGGFSSDQPTEDIELTWRLHRHGYRCIYEPAAQVGMQVPETLKLWLRQRTRWSSGLVRVLQRHGFYIVKNLHWKMFPILLEAVLAIIWCHLLVLMTIYWLIGLWYGIPDLGNKLILTHWGFMTVGVAILQILWGIHLDASHDKGITKLRILAPVYPLLYWMMSAVVVVISTIPTLLKRPQDITWASPRLNMGSQ